MTNPFFLKTIGVCLLFFPFLIYGQEVDNKNVILVNTNFLAITNVTPEVQINDVSTPRLVYKSFIVQKKNTDSVEIKIPYKGVFFNKKEKIFRFSIKEKNNYFKYTYRGVIVLFPFVKQITGDDLVKLKKKKYLKNKIKEFGLE